jgi:hypothetical protein
MISMATAFLWAGEYLRVACAAAMASFKNICRPVILEGCLRSSLRKAPSILSAAASFGGATRGRIM